MNTAYSARRRKASRRGLTLKGFARAGLIGLARFLDDNTATLLFIGLVFILGVLVGAGIPKAAGAHEPSDKFIGTLEPLEVPGSTITEVLAALDAEFAASGQGDAPPYTEPCCPIFETRHARWGRPLNPAMIARKLTFTARFAIFPEYEPDTSGAPSLRRFDFDKDRWE